MKQHKKTALNNLHILDGQWGIFKNTEQLPQVRWDPFRILIDKNNIKIGHHSYISTLRAERPDEYLITANQPIFYHLEEQQDSFCRLIAGELPSIIVSRDLDMVNSPLCTESAFEKLGDSTVFTSINLYTPMTRILISKQKSNHSYKSISQGIPLLHIFSKHYHTIEEVPIEEMVLYLKNIILSINQSQKVLSTINDTTSVFHFYNIGPNAGSSIPHLHSQTLLYTAKGYGWKNYSFFRSFEDNQHKNGRNSYCIGCEYIKGSNNDFLGQQLHMRERTLWEDENWIVFTAYAPERDGHIRLLPKRHVSSLWELNSSEITSLAKALKYANNALSQFILHFGGKLHIKSDRNILFRQQHFGYSPPIHMLIDIIPVQQVGGAEILDDHRLSHILPEETTSLMKITANKG